MAEEPLLDAKGAASVKLGIRTLEFNRHYLLVILGRASSDMNSETTQSANEMLYLLQDLVSDSEEVYNGIVWQLVCCPFTPFLFLFGEILANKEADQESSTSALRAMQELPTFLKKMGVRNTLAAKLERIAVVILQHAESVVQTRYRTYRPRLRPRMDTKTDHRFDIDHDFSTATGPFTEARPVAVDDFDWDSFLNHTTTASYPHQTGDQYLGGGDYLSSSTDGDSRMWTDMFLGDASIDWIGLGDTLSI